MLVVIAAVLPGGGDEAGGIEYSSPIGPGPAEEQIRAVAEGDAGELRGERGLGLKIAGHGILRPHDQGGMRRARQPVGRAQVSAHLRVRV